MERCFSCAEISKCSEMYARKPFDYRGPYFPIFERFNPPSSSNSISADGTVKVCELCHIFLLSQWQNYERQGILESRRIYFTKRHDSAMYSNNDYCLSANADSNFGSKSNYSLITKNGDQRSDSINVSTKTPLPPVTGNSVNNKSCLLESQSDKTELSPFESSVLDLGSKQLTEHHICCFVCGLPCLKWHAKTAYSSQVLENKEYFPFFEKLDPPQLSIGLTNGATKICIQCESDLQKQWEHYESRGDDQMFRTYHITNEHSNLFSITNPGRFITNSMMSNPLFAVIKMKNTTVKCALCPNKVIDPYTVSWNQRASGLVISNLKNFAFPTEGVMVDKQTEEAIICDVCHYFLSYQMQAYNTNMTPLHLREYKLPKVGSLSTIMPSSNDKQQQQQSQQQQQQTTNNRKPVTLGSSLSAFSAPEGWQQTNSSQLKRSKTPTLKNRSKTPVQFTDNNRSNSTSKTHIGNQDQIGVLGPIIAHCHICLHELRDPNTLKTLPSAVNEETPDQAYFPFLKTLRMNSMKNYEFPVCVHCYYNLHGQWQMFHKAAVPIYERKYNHYEFMCTQCQHLFAQKTDIVIVRDRLLCVSCSENRGCDATKNTANVANQDTDATNSHNSLLSIKTKATVTVTPISNELSGSNLATLNYADTMKQLNATKLFDTTVPPKPTVTGTPVPLGNSVSQFPDISRHSSLSSDLYQNSKNLFNKSMKRPVVAAVAPNQRQNTPHMPNTESMASHSDLRMKMPDIANFHGNLFTQNSAFNSFNSGSSNYSLPMFSPNSAFALHSPHAPISRKSSKSDRDSFLQHTTNFSNPYFDQKSRVNSNSLASSASSNPFINWTQQHHPTELSHGFQSMQSLPTNPFEQSMSTNKEAEMTMLLYMMYQKQMYMANESGNKFPGNSWPTNNNNSNPSFEEMAAAYYQSMMTQPQHSNPGMLPPDDLLSAATGNSIQSYMMNAAMANYQYNQMFQMLAAYQQQAASNVNSKPLTNVPSWFNQFNMADQTPKRSRPDSAMFEQPINNKAASTPNGFNELIKYSEMLKSSMGNDHDKIQSNKYQSMNIDSRQLYNQKSMDYVDTLDRKMSTRQSRSDEYCLTEMKRSPKQNSHGTNVIDAKARRVVTMKGNQELDVLDLSQNKPSTYKCSYAIDSLTELGQKCRDHDAQDLNQSNASSISLSEFNHGKRQNTSTHNSVLDFEEPLNMFNVCLDQSSTAHTSTAGSESQVQHDRLMGLLNGVGAQSLVSILNCPTATVVTERKLSSSSTVTRFKKCPTISKYHQFLSQINRVFVRSDENILTNTRCKSAFMRELGLEMSPSTAVIGSFITPRTNKSAAASPNKLYWTKWILKTLQHRVSLNVKPHLRRSLMRPVLSGDLEVRLCTAKHKHELESLRNILKILIKFT